MGRLNIGSDGEPHYFGSQSGYNLVHSKLNDVSRKTWAEMRRQGVDTATQLNMHATVTDELRDHLLELYWKWKNNWNYVIHKPSFMRDLRAGHGKFCSPLLLSAVLAIASCYSDRPELRTVYGTPYSPGSAFAEQAKILMLYESEAPTVTTVQAASLMSLRAMSDHKEALGWLYAGMRSLFIRDERHVL